jgi:metal-responsive CopG/Arc/MetJ family transcriptional regulator
METIQTFNISFPKTLVRQIDAKASEQFGSRSDFLRAATIQYLRNEAEWELIFREGQKIGTQIKPRAAEEVADAITTTRRQSGRWIIKNQ